MTSPQFQNDALDALEALCYQESRGYQVCDYLGDATAAGSNVDLLGPLHMQVDASSRKLMVQWCSNLVDFCNYDHETTATAVSCLDRFLSTTDGFSLLYNSEQFQLAAMCAMYTTAKIHERQALEPCSIAKLSRGMHTPESVEAMERRMLQALQWRVNPPTVMRFVNVFFDLIPVEMMNETIRQSILKLVKFQVNLALSEYQLSIGYRHSHLALAAFLNAIDSQTCLGETVGPLIQARIGSILHMCNDVLLLEIRCALYQEIARDFNTEPVWAALASKMMSISHSAMAASASIDVAISQPHQEQCANKSNKGHMMASNVTGSPRGVFGHTMTT